MNPVHNELDDGILLYIFLTHYEVMQSYPIHDNDHYLHAQAELGHDRCQFKETGRFLFVVRLITKIQGKNKTYYCEVTSPLSKEIHLRC